MTAHPRPASLARRALPAVAVLGASGVLLTRLGGPSEAVSPTTTAAPTNAAAKAPSSAATRTPTTTPPATAAPTTTRPRAAGAPGVATTPTAPATTAPSAATGAACTGTTYTGQAFANRYGTVQVAAVVGADKKLCDVEVLSYPDGDRKSIAINDRALPTLHTEAVAARSASIAGVTGATLTSNGYKSSLQSALDQVR